MKLRLLLDKDGLEASRLGAQLRMYCNDVRAPMVKSKIVQCIIYIFYIFCTLCIFNNLRVYVTDSVGKTTLLSLLHRTLLEFFSIFGGTTNYLQTSGLWACCTYFSPYHFFWMACLRTLCWSTTATTPCDQPGSD